jgi:hypothetical protein
MVTLVVLVVLSMLGYTLAGRVSAQRHRDNYIIDYQQARYACDSAMKYAFATLQDINDLKLISRPNEPDFSDLFALSEEEYQALLADWAAQQILYGSKGYGDVCDVNDVNAEGKRNDGKRYKEDINMAEALNDLNYPDYSDANAEMIDLNEVTIPGPYGPEWPFVTEPVEFEIGSAKVKVEIEDENAKYPVGWTAIRDPKVQREAQASFQTFCEWMGLTNEEVDTLTKQADKLAKIKQFKVDFQPVRVRTQTTTGTTQSAGGRARRVRTVYRNETIPSAQQLSKQAKDFAQLLHGSLIDAEMLARPTIVSETRKESALKYAGMWGSSKVNINSAPRHVLEAAFAFGGNADKIAEEIIRRRRVRPFTNIEELRQALFGYSDSIGKCEKYITAQSDCFVIRVTATSGTAKASAAAAIIKTGSNVQKVAVISD